jgi:hypothetical protein
MFYIYLQVLLLGHHDASCVSFGDLPSKEGRVISYDGLDARLVMHVLYEFFIDFGSHQSHHVLKSLLASEEILHIEAMYPFIISRMSNECDVLSNVVRGRLSHSSAFTRSTLLPNSLPFRSHASGAAT